MYIYNFYHLFLWILFTILQPFNPAKKYNSQKFFLPIFEKQQQNLPNIVFIVVDDLGWKDVGYMGGDFFETPNIDYLASEGIFFTHSYAAAANCAPSRACMMTGQNTPRHGVYTVSPSARGNAKDRKLIPATNTDSISHESITLAEIFKKAGYQTGTFGKWHLGENPLLQGFDVNFGGNQRGNPGTDGYFSPYNLSYLENGPPGEHLTDRLTTEAISFMQNHRDKPFFLYLPYYAVHTPIQAKKHLAKKYQSRYQQNFKGIDPVYAAMVENTDINIGRILKNLEILNLRENTIVVFTSDNGGIASIATQLPLRAGKGSYYEGGIRVPLIIRWPGKVQPGTVSDVPVVNLDFYPTFAELLNISEINDPLDGTSLLPLLEGKTLDKRPLIWHFPIYLQAYNGEKDDARDPLFRTRPGSVIRSGDWKLHQYFEFGDIELYHLPTDPGERNNLRDSHPEKVEELLGMLENWRINTGAPLPSDENPSFKQ